MVAQIIVKQIPPIEGHDMGDTLPEIRAILPYMEYDIPGLHYLDIQPGVGKTHAVMEFLKKEDSFIVVTGTHKLLKGEYEKLGAEHWKSFAARCKEYKKLKKLHSLGVPITFICDFQKCEKHKCEYWKQFKHPKAIAPYHFLPTDRVTEDDKFKFNMLVLDEAMTGYNTVEVDFGELIEINDAISKHVDEGIPFDLFLHSDSGEHLFDFLLKNKKRINRIKYSALHKAISKEKWEDVEKISSFNIFELLKFAYYKSIHEEITSYDEPLFYEIIDLARQGVPIILLDASFDADLFQLMLGRYAYEDNKQPRSLLLDKELQPLEDVKIKVYQSSLKRKERKIYRMDKDNYYYKKGFSTHDKELTAYGSETIDKLRSFIERTKRKYPNVGIITYQDLTQYFKDLGKTEYFFNLRGSNIMESSDVLFIIGTPQANPKDTVTEYNKLAMTNIDPKETYRRTYAKKDGKFLIKDPLTGEEELRIIGEGKEKIPDSLQPKGEVGSERIMKFQKQYEDGIVDLDVWYPLPALDQFKSESEQYQAIHRARPLIKEKEVYIFGHVPMQIKEEFDVIPLDKKETDAYFMGSRLYGIYPLSLWLSITRIYQEKDLSSAEIAKELRIYKKDKKTYNTPFITAIIKGDVSPQDIIKIDKLLKENPEITVKGIKRKYKSFKGTDEFLDYCIFYAKKGGRIMGNSLR